MNNLHPPRRLRSEARAEDFVLQVALAYEMRKLRELMAQDGLRIKDTIRVILRYNDDAPHLRYKPTFGWFEPLSANLAP
jgi:hypothetical protein